MIARARHPRPMGSEFESRDASGNRGASKKGTGTARGFDARTCRPCKSDRKEGQRALRLTKPPNSCAGPRQEAPNVGVTLVVYIGPNDSGTIAVRPGHHGCLWHIYPLTM